MKITSISTLAFCCLLSALTTQAKAAITYVSATNLAGGNTVNTSDGSPTNWTNNASGVPDNTRVNGDNLWGTPPSNQGFTTTPTTLVWESSGEDAPGLTTTVSGLPNSNYEVYLLWQNLAGAAGDWDISAKLSTDPAFTTYALTWAAHRHFF